MVKYKVEQCEKLTFEVQNLAEIMMRPFYEKYRINYLKLVILREIMKNDVNTLNTLSQKLGKAATNLSVVISEMEEEGFVQRKRSINDHRVLLIQPKHKGKEISNLSYEYVARVFSVYFETDDIFESLVDVLERYKEKLEQVLSRVK